MEGNSYNLFVNVITLACAGYCLYLWYQLQTKGIAAPNSPLIPKDRQASDCLDPESYVAYIKPRTLILGLVVLLSSVFGFLDGNLFEAVFWVQMVSIALPLAVLVWYGVCFSKARKLYW